MKTQQILEVLRESADLERIAAAAVRLLTERGRAASGVTADLGYEVAQSFLVEQLTALVDEKLGMALELTEAAEGPLPSDPNAQNAWTDAVDASVEAMLSAPPFRNCLTSDFAGEYFIDCQVHIPKRRAQLKTRVARAVWENLAQAPDRVPDLIDEILDFDRLMAKISELWAEHRATGAARPPAKQSPRLSLGEFFALAATKVGSEQRNPRYLETVLAQSRDSDAFLRANGLGLLCMPPEFDTTQWGLSVPALAEEFLKYLSAGASAYVAPPAPEAATSAAEPQPNTNENADEIEECDDVKKVKLRGDLVRILRTDCGFVGAEVASMLGVSNATVSNWVKKGFANQVAVDPNCVRAAVLKLRERLSAIEGVIGQLDALAPDVGHAASRGPLTEDTDVDISDLL